MRVGVVVRMEADTDIDEKFAEVRAMGMESCQLVCWERKIINDEKAAEAILAAAEKHGITISAFWCGWGGRKVWDFYDGQLTLGLVPADYRAERVRMLLEGSDFAKKLGVIDFVTHVGYMPENPYDPNYQGTLNACKEVAERCKKNGQVFLFETGQETPVTLKRAMQDIEKERGQRMRGSESGSGESVNVRKSQPGGCTGCLRGIRARCSRKGWKISDGWTFPRRRSADRAGKSQLSCIYCTVKRSGIRWRHHH